MEFIKDLWMYLKERKKWWLMPVIIILLLFGLLIVISSGSAIAPFIYTLFWFEMKDKSKIYETSLVLTTGFLVIYLLTENVTFLYVSIFFGLVGIFVKPLAYIITKIWFWLADILNLFFSKLVLGLLFYAVLLPLALIYKAAGNDKLRLKEANHTTWILRNDQFRSSDFKRIW